MNLWLVEPFLIIFVITFGWVCCCFAVAPTQKWWQKCSTDQRFILKTNTLEPYMIFLECYSKYFGWRRSLHHANAKLIGFVEKSRFSNCWFRIWQRTWCLVHVVVKKLISILVTDYIQKRTGQALLFSFEYNLLQNLISNFNHYMDRAWVHHVMPWN
jgi:hypothetical protein